MADMGTALENYRKSQGFDPADAQERLKGEQAGAIKNTLQEAAKINPDQRAADYKLAEAEGVPVNHVVRNRDRIKARNLISGLPVDAMVDLSPGTAQAMRDPKIAGVFWDTAEDLHKMEQASINIMSAPERYVRSYLQSADTGLSMRTANHLSAKEGLFGPLEGDEQKELDEILNTPRFDFGIKDKGLGGSLLAAPGVMLESTLPTLLDMAIGTAAGAATGFGTGFVAGAPVGAFLGSVLPGPGTLAGAGAVGLSTGVAGARVGSKLGGYLGIAIPMFGSLWRDMKDIEGLDDNTRRLLALGGAGFGALLEKTGAEAIVRGGLGDALKDKVFRKSLRRFAGDVAGAGLVEAGTEAAQVFTDLVPNLLGFSLAEGGGGLLETFSEENVSKFTYTDQDGNKLTGWGAVWVKVMESAKMGLQGGVGSTAALSGASVAAQEVRARSAVSLQPSFDKLNEIIMGGPLGERDPDTTRDAIKKQIKAGSSPKTIYVKASAVREFFQSDQGDDGAEGPTNELLGKVTDLQAKLAEAELDNADIEIPYEEYIAYVIPTRLGAAITKDVRIDPRDMTANEADSWVRDNAASFGSLQDLASVVQGDAEVLSLVRQELTKQNKKGHGKIETEALVDFQIARIVTRAARAGKSVQEMIEREGVFRLEVAGGQAVRLGPTLQERTTRTRLKREVGDIQAGSTPETKRLKRAPVLTALRDRGGVDPDSNLGLEILQQVPRTGKGSLPGLFRKDGFRRTDEIPVMDIDVLRDNFTIEEGVGDTRGGRDSGNEGTGTPEMSTGDLMHAITREQAGDPLRTGDEQAAIGAVEAERGRLRDKIEALGLDVKTATNQQIVDALMAEAHEGNVEAVESEEFFQTNRASIEISEDLRDVVVRFLAAANGTSMLHEGGHLWLAQLEFDANQKGARVGIKRDWAAVQKWLGVKKGAKIATAQHERFARAVEQWLMEGRAPSIELMPSFQRFTTWILGAYKTLKNKYFKDVDLNDDIRLVLDRMVATDKQIRQAQAVRGLEHSVLSTDDGITPAQSQALAEAIGEARRESETRGTNIQIARARARASKAWKNALQGVKEEVTLEVNNRPEIMAMQWLTHGGKALPGQVFPDAVEGIRHQRFSKAGLIQAANGDKDVTDSKVLGSGAFGFWQKEGGYHPDVVAEWFGFPDGRTLIERLAGIKKNVDGGTNREAIIKSETERVMKERHGVFETSAQLADAVAEAASNAKALGALHAEEQMLAALTNNRSLPQGVVKEIAKKIIAKTTIERMLPGRYQAAALAEARDAIEAHANGDLAKMQLHKQRQIINIALEAEARRVRLEATKAANNANRMGMKPAQKILGKAAKGSTAFQDQMNGLLNRFNFRLTLANQQQRQSIKEFTLEWREKEAEMRISPLVLNENFKKPWGEMTWTELQEVDDAIRNIYHVAKTLLGEQVGERKANRESIQADLTADAEKLRLEPHVDPKTSLEKAGVQRELFFAGLARIEFITDRLGASWREHIWDPIAASEARAVKMLKEVAQPLNLQWTELIKANRTRYYSVQTYKGLTHRWNPEGRWTRSELIAIALNMGNASNKEKLLKGYGWTEAQVMVVLNQELNAADRAFIQSTWTAMKTLWPAIKEQELRSSGVAPQEIQATKVVFADGTELEGGYYPVIYDLTRGDLTNPVKLKSSNKSELYSDAAQIQRAITGHAHTFERDKHAVGPLSTSMSVIPNHLKAVIHDLAYRETLSDVWGILNDEALIKTMNDRIGVAETSLFKPWLKDIAGERNYDAAAMQQWNNAFRKARTHTTVFTLGGRLTTLLVQPLGNFNAAGLGRREFGAGVFKKYHLEALGEQFKSPVVNYEFAKSMSKFMANRVHSMDRDLRDALEDTSNSALWADRAGSYAMRVIANSQMHSVDVPVWMAAFRAAQLEKGMTEAQAVGFADGMVSKSQGSGGVKDQSQFQRVEGIGKFLTLFYSYQNTVYNNLHESAREGVDFQEAIMQYTMQLLLPALGTLALHQAMQTVESALFGLDDPDEDESFMHQMVVAGAIEGLGLFPLLRNLQSAAGELLGAGRYFDPADPIDRFIDYGYRSARGLKGTLTKQDLKSFNAFTINALRVASIYYRLPTDYLLSRADRRLRQK